ncbi:16S rRNA (guanine(527)-N(7))-methyltransferase RsmG [Oceaniglobus roseus]|uniref:16S rRNA (guanine(527)-N(7))-methyltransferase RsmG n=1 Tax=Oceaniglobus roseus TaxID=1737570 RepID=UPI000C7F65CE|nr:16S rRNA (guanine(527)-N(7))-methyltransferase RsmG [Kandeliimicrobium roseum]
MNVVDGRQKAEYPNVSRETLDRLALYADLLVRWNGRINLVSRTTLANLGPRHIADSLQLRKYAPQGARTWLDLGTGAGFPGLVLALASADWENPPKFTLVESDRRKCEFLRSVARQTETAVEILTERIEDLPSQEADVISARALAPLDHLLSLASPHGHGGTTYIFPKGGRHSEEIAGATTWSFDCDVHDSETDAVARILVLRNLRRV